MKPCLILLWMIMIGGDASAQDRLLLENLCILDVERGEMSGPQDLLDGNPLDDIKKIRSAFLAVQKGDVVFRKDTD